jgi:aspartate racemase
MKDNRQTVGIVGGLCPLATADIYFKAMKQVKASNGDTDYPDIIINAAVEQECRGNTFDDMRNYDMSHRILYIYQVAAELKRQHVDRILVPDFLSHSSIKSISHNIQTPIIDIVAVVVGQIQSTWPNVRNIGLLTTSSSIREQVFERQFTDANLRAIYPDADIQEAMVMEAIYGPEGVKRGYTSGKSGQLVQKACEHLIAKGADLIATAVTELPLIERRYYPQNGYLDCNEAIAKELVNGHGVLATMEHRRSIVGIIGGLGPAATVDIFDKIVKHTPANRDQDHIKIIIENNPQIPDRTAALYGNGEDPSIALLASAEKLKSAGADFIIVPCNTAHAFLESVQQHVKIPILSMIEETVRHIAIKYPTVHRVGLLATSGTILSKVYEEPFSKAGIDLLVPSTRSQQDLVMEAIYGEGGIKSGQYFGLPRERLLAAAQELIGEGAQLIVLGCTEIPLAIKDGDVDVSFVDPSDILARVTVEHAIQKTIPDGIS